ncbi:MAG: hypothetical protein GY711_27675 [bacterium]|nr:hypothetical protein [bacterium]
MPTIRIPSATEFVVLRQTYDAAELDDYSALMAKYLAEGDYLVLSLPQELPRADFEWALDALITTFGSPMTCWLLALGPEPARAVVTTASGHTFPANARLIGVELVRPNDAPEGDCLSTNERTTVTELVRAIEAAVGTARLAIPATRHPR